MMAMAASSMVFDVITKREIHVEPFSSRCSTLSLCGNNLPLSCKSGIWKASNVNGDVSGSFLRKKKKVLGQFLLKNEVLAVSGSAVTAALASEEAPSTTNLSKLKADLLGAVAGLDRGLVASQADEEAADEAAKKLESVSNPVQLPEDLDKLQGLWRLVFSSGFGSGSFGGQRPGPSISRAPFSLGLVYQRIDVLNRELDNIVDLRIPTPWPLPGLEITATLVHSFELAGGSRIRILFEKTVLRPSAGLSELPPFELPQLPDFLRQRSNRQSGSGEFETTYLDKDLRISRGDRGELRIFVRA